MPRSLKPIVASHLRESSRVIAATASVAPQIAQAAELLLTAYRKGRKALIFGNGGSAAEAQHFAAELVGRFARNRPALPALALTVNSSDLTAIGNDFGFDDAFSRQIEAHARPGDVAVAMTTSGNSANVLKAVAAAKKMGLKTVGLTGAHGGRLKDAVNVCVRVPANDVARIQEAHAAVIHIWCSIIEDTLYATSPKAH
jgi:D-sedoheptulose 7-phosphate isomerase